MKVFVAKINGKAAVYNPTVEQLEELRAVWGEALEVEEQEFTEKINYRTRDTQQVWDDKGNTVRTVMYMGLCRICNRGIYTYLDGEEGTIPSNRKSVGIAPTQGLLGDHVFLCEADRDRYGEAIPMKMLRRRIWRKRRAG